VDFSDPDTLWLNVTNIVLGLVTIIALVFLAATVLRELAHRFATRTVRETDEHQLFVPELGLTMADGGEPLHNDEPQDNIVRSEN
jgi:hypothetical protein